MHGVISRGDEIVMLSRNFERSRSVASEFPVAETSSIFPRQARASRAPHRSYDHEPSVVVLEGSTPSAPKGHSELGGHRSPAETSAAGPMRPSTYPRSRG